MKETSSLGRTEVKILLQKLSIKSFGDVYEALKSSIVPNNSSFFYNFSLETFSLAYVEIKFQTKQWRLISDTLLFAQVT